MFLKTVVFKAARPPKCCVVKTNSMLDEGAQKCWMTGDVAKRLGLRSKVRELLITSGFANARSSPKFYEVVES